MENSIGITQRNLCIKGLTLLLSLVHENMMPPASLCSRYRRAHVPPVIWSESTSINTYVRAQVSASCILPSSFIFGLSAIPIVWKCWDICRAGNFSLLGWRELLSRSREPRRSVDQLDSWPRYFLLYTLSCALRWPRTKKPSCALVLTVSVMTGTWYCSKHVSQHTRVGSSHSGRVNMENEISPE